MSIPNTTRIKRRPTHPGEMLREDFLPDYGLTVSTLAQALGVSRQSSKHPPAEPGALGREPLEAANGVADAAPHSCAT